MLRVNHRVIVGADSYTAAQRSRLVGMRIHAALATPVNNAWIEFAPAQGLPDFTGGRVVVELGYADELKTVFTGWVETVNWGGERMCLRASGCFRSLVSARFNRLFEKSKAGDIALDIAGLVQIATGSVESGMEFQAYALNDGVTAYEGLRQLAERCDFDLYADVEDKLVFAKYVPAETHRFQFGVNILALHVGQPNESITGVEVYGESPASFGQGSETYSWLTKKDVKGVAGSGSGTIHRRFDPAGRTQEGAEKIAEGLLASLSAKRSCTLKTIGAPEVRLGDAVEISRMPVASQNGRFKITGVRHRLDMKQGFYTVIDGVDV